MEQGLLSLGNRHGVPNLNQGRGCSHFTPGKRMQPIILLSAKDKIVGQTDFFNLGMATSLGEGKL